MGQSVNLSANSKRNLAYNLFLMACQQPNSAANLGSIVALGTKMMRKAKLHPHFFNDNTLHANAKYLACFALQLPPAQFNALLPLDSAMARAIFEIFEQRISQRIPVEYITKEAEYMGYKFYVNEHVLVPRSLMSTRFTDFLQMTTWHNYRVLDLCSGSGCIGITLALLNPQIKVDLVDCSLDALEVAATNVNLHGLKGRVTCIQSDLFTQINSKYDLIITNPPYVSSKEYAKVPAEFKREPKIALESGHDGLGIIHKILLQGQQYLNPHGKIIAEVGYQAAKTIKKKYPHFNFEWLSYRQPGIQPQATWFAKWCAPLVAMDCIFIIGN